MRISLISFHFAEYAARLAIALSSRNRVQLHLSRDNADAELTGDLRAGLERSVEVHFHSRITRVNSPFHGARIARQIWRFGPDVVHGQEAGDWAHAAVRLLVSTVPFVYTVHDPRSHSGNDRQVAMRNRLPRRFLRRHADALIVHGSSIVSDMALIEPRARGKIYVVMHGILGEPLPPPSALGEPFMFFGRIEAYKGLGVLLDAIELLEVRGNWVKLRIVGRGPDLDRHRARIAALRDVELVESFVAASKVPETMRTSRAIILPYRDATQSGVVANAFAAGIPVIASRVGALVDVLNEGVNALLVPPDDPEALADAISCLAGDMNLAKRLAFGAAATASSLLSWSVIASETEAVYAKLITKDLSEFKPWRAERSDLGRDTVDVS